MSDPSLDALRESAVEDNSTGAVEAGVLRGIRFEKERRGWHAVVPFLVAAVASAVAFFALSQLLVTANLPSADLDGPPDLPSFQEEAVASR